MTHIDTQQAKSLCLCGFERGSLPRLFAIHAPHTIAHIYATFAYRHFLANMC